MSLKLVQLRGENGEGLVGLTDADAVTRRIQGYSSTYALALAAIEQDRSLADLARDASTSEMLDLQAAADEGRLLPPILHPDPAHLYLTGTGLTHLGSAEGRDKMHKAASEATTDSMKMFLMGVEGGKPGSGRAGVQPEWFYKGDGSSLVGPNADLPSPAFALDGGEEPEIAGIYIIDGRGRPRRLGFTLANEFSDHVTERGNYLWLAHSKLRPAALGAELLLGDLPAQVTGTSRILREGQVIWEKPFLSGEDNMSHSIANLEHHHFKYGLFRRPGDVHVHFFGTATLSFSDAVQTQEGDVFEIAAEPFTLPLRNRLAREADEQIEIVPL